MLRLRLASLATAMLVVSAFNGFFFILGNPLRLTFVANTFVPFLAVGFALGAAALIGCVLWIRVLRVTVIEVLILGYLLILLLAADWRQVEPALILLDFAKPLLFLAIVVLLRNGLPPSVSLKRPVATIGWASVMLSLALLAVCWGLRFAGVPMYPAYMTLDGALGVGVLWNSGVGVPLYAVAAFLSGKRGLYAAFAGILLLWCIRRWGWRTPLMFVLIGALGGLATFLVTGFMAGASPLTMITSFMFKSAELGERGEPLLRFLMGGRMEEFEGAFAGTYGTLELLIGRGLGFSYALEGAGISIPSYRNLHFTPAALLIYYGSFFMGLFTFYLAPLVFRAIDILLRSNEVVELTYASYFLVCLIYSLTEYSVFAYSNFAVSIGALMSLRIQRTCRQEQ